MSPDEIAEVALFAQEIGIVRYRGSSSGNQVLEVALQTEVNHLGVLALLLQHEGAIADRIVGEGDTQEFDSQVVVA